MAASERWARASLSFCERYNSLLDAFTCILWMFIMQKSMASSWVLKSSNAYYFALCSVHLSIQLSQVPTWWIVVIKLNQIGVKKAYNWIQATQFIHWMCVCVWCGECSCRISIKRNGRKIIGWEGMLKLNDFTGSMFRNELSCDECTSNWEVKSDECGWHSLRVEMENCLIHCKQPHKNNHPTIESYRRRSLHIFPSFSSSVYSSYFVTH